MASPAPECDARTVFARDFHFDLPDDLIAQEPPARRRDARLLHVPKGAAPVHGQFAELPELLEPGDLLVLNDTRVFPARLHLHRASGGSVEVLLTRCEGDTWRALVKPRKRLTVGERLSGGDGAFEIEIVEHLEEDVRVRIVGAEDAEVLARFGEVPLPPYIRRSADASDEERYQTVFAEVEGAVAAPTAGLHFDDDLLEALRKADVAIEKITLHVGPGTFRPLPGGDLSGHRLHAEELRIDSSVTDAIRRTREAGGRVVAVGTTVVRTLEAWAQAGEPSTLEADTELFIYPGFRFRVVDALVTNFHLPGSSLLCLVAAFSGRDEILRAYEIAIENRYRFYSYGDATFLERAT